MGEREGWEMSKLCAHKCPWKAREIGKMGTDIFQAGWHPERLHGQMIAYLLTEGHKMDQRTATGGGSKEESISAFPKFLLKIISETGLKLEAGSGVPTLPSAHFCEEAGF
jgi:hypothetical protein